MKDFFLVINYVKKGETMATGYKIVFVDLISYIRHGELLNGSEYTYPRALLSIRLFCGSKPNISRTKTRKYYISLFVSS